MHKPHTRFVQLGFRRYSTRKSSVFLCGWILLCNMSRLILEGVYLLHVIYNNTIPIPSFQLELSCLSARKNFFYYPNSVVCARCILLFLKVVWVKSHHLYKREIPSNWVKIVLWRSYRQYHLKASTGVHLNLHHPREEMNQTSKGWMLSWEAVELVGRLSLPISTQRWEIWPKLPMMMQYWKPFGLASQRTPFFPLVLLDEIWNRSKHMCGDTVVRNYA